jgi:hypothetical protein
MIKSHKHSKELYWLERRIAFVKAINELTAYNADVYEMTALAYDFREVESPSDLVQRLRDIYGNDLT